jgi:membrane glycosyltransferase
LGSGSHHADVPARFALDLARVLERGHRLCHTPLHDDPVSHINPALRATAPFASIHTRTAIGICIRHENVAGVAVWLTTMQSGLIAIGEAAYFEFHVLSNSIRPEVYAEEWAAFAHDPVIHYRRRHANTG